MDKVEMRQAYGYDVDAASAASALHCLDQSKTVQSDAMESDINVIVERFGLTGMLPERGSVPLVTNGEFVESVNFRDAMDIVNQAERSFAQMPADVRARFGNDAVKFVDFCSQTDEASLKEMVRLGLAVPKPAEVVPPPLKVEVVNEAAAPPK